MKTTGSMPADNCQRASARYPIGTRWVPLSPGCVGLWGRWVLGQSCVEGVGVGVV